MKLKSLLVAASLCATTSLAFALDIQPYSSEILAAKQKANEAVSLHFHADWCPVCRAQDQVFNAWKGDAAVPGTLLLVNYDNERELKKKLGVRTQSTVIVFKGTSEKTRIAGETDPKVLRAALDAAR